MGEEAVEIRLLGRFAVVRDGDEIPPSAFGGRMVRTLIRLLVTRRGRFVSKDELAEALWPDRPPADPGANLEVLVSRARRALGDPELIRTGPGGYAFVGGERCGVDVERFLAAVEAGRTHLEAGRASAALRHLRDGLALWTGEPLPEDSYSDWAREPRASLARAHLEGLENAARAAIAVRDPGAGVPFAERAVAREPLREASQLLLVHALAESGDRAGALRAFESFRGALADELGLDPSAEAFEIQGRVLRGEPLSSPPAAPVVAASSPAAELAFVGRESELAALRALAADGPAKVALLVGVGGAGKSRLLAETAVTCGLPALSVRAFPAQANEPWSLARTLLREAIAQDALSVSVVPGYAARALLDVLPELGELRGIPSLEVDPESRHALIVEGAVAVVAAACPAPTLAVVDDLQWVDSSSVGLLEQIVLRVPGIRLLAAARPDELGQNAAATALAARLRATEPMVELELGRLPAAAIADLVGDPELAGAIASQTDGTPLAVGHVLRLLADAGAVEPDARGRWSARRGLPEGLVADAARTGQREAIRHRYERLPPARREMLELLSLLGREAPPRSIASAMDLPLARTLEGLDGLERAGLVRAGEEGWATAHDVVAETVAGSLSPAGRAIVHARLAETLIAEGAAASEVAVHLAGAGDPEASAESYAAAAEDALARLAGDVTIRHADAGLSLRPAEPIARRLRRARAEARARHGDLAGARDDLRHVAATAPTGPERAACLTRLAMLAAGSEDYERAGELVEVALAEASDDGTARANALAVAAIVSLNLGDLDGSERRSAEAVALYEALGDAHGSAGILDGRAMAMFLGGRVAEAVDAFDRVAGLFIDSGEFLRVGTPRSTRGHALVFMADPASGLVDVETALELERTLGHPEGVAYCLWHRSEALAALARPGEAVQSAREALDIAERIGHREWTVASLRGLGISYEAAGDLSAAEAQHRRSLELAENMPLFASWAAARLASVLVAAGRAPEAEPLVQHALGIGTPLSHYEARLASVELAVAMDDPRAPGVVREARRLAEAGGHLVSARRLAALAPP